MNQTIKKFMQFIILFLFMVCWVAMVRTENFMELFIVGIITECLLIITIVLRIFKEQPQ